MSDYDKAQRAKFTRELNEWLSFLYSAGADGESGYKKFFFCKPRTRKLDGRRRIFSRNNGLMFTTNAVDGQYYANRVIGRETEARLEKYKPTLYQIHLEMIWNALEALYHAPGGPGYKEALASFSAAQ